MANESHSNLAVRQPISNNPNPSNTNNQNATLTKSNNHINVHHHNHSHINTSLGHKSPAFVVKPSIFPFLNRLWIETRTKIYIYSVVHFNKWIVSLHSKLKYKNKEYRIIAKLEQTYIDHIFFEQICMYFWKSGINLHNLKGLRLQCVQYVSWQWG